MVVKPFSVAEHATLRSEISHPKYAGVGGKQEKKNAHGCVEGMDGNGVGVEGIDGYGGGTQSRKREQTQDLSVVCGIEANRSRLGKHGVRWDGGHGIPSKRGSHPRQRGTVANSGLYNPARANRLSAAS